MTPRSPALWTLTRRRFATPRSAALVIVALVAFAAFVIAAAPRALVEVVRAEAAHQLSSIPPLSRDLSAEVSGEFDYGPAPDREDVAGWDAGAADVFGALAGKLGENRASFEPALARIAAPAQFAVFSGALLLIPQELPVDAPFSRVQVLAEPAASGALSVQDGAWPEPWIGQGAVEIALSVDAAATMQWPVGEERGIPTSASRPLSDGWQPDAPVFRLVATVDALDATADRWVHLPTSLQATVFDDGNRRPEATAAGWVAPGTWELLTARWFGPLTTLSAWYPIDGAAAAQEDPATLLAAARAATSSPVPLDDAGQVRARFSSAVVEVLATALARTDSASAILAVAATGPLAVSVALIVLAGALIVRRRRTDLVLLSARGASLGRLRGLLFGEGVVLGLPAAILAAVAGVALTPEDAGPLPTLIAVLVGFAPALALALTLRPALLAPGRADLDAPVRGRGARIAEALVVLLALVAVTLLLVRGIGARAEGVDPLVVAAPLLATVALALVIVRLHPLPLVAALRDARRGRGVVALVGAARSLRDPAAGTTAVLAMLVAVAIAVFSSLILATVDRGAVVAAQREVGADIQLAGPFFAADSIERMRAVEGVVDAVGVLRGEHLAVEGGDGRASAQAVVTDVARLAEVQRGMVGGVPADALEPGADPTQVITSSALADEIGGGDTVVGDVAVSAVASVQSVLGQSLSTQFLLVDAADYATFTELGFNPRAVYVDVADGADPRAVAAELARIVAQPHSARFLDESTDEIRSSPAVSALRIVLLAALAIAVALSVVALLLVAGVSRDARSRVIALLRMLGLDRRRGRGIVVWEFAPLGITALVGGIVLGAVLPLLVVSSIDLRPFTGGAAQPALAIDPVLTTALIAVVVLALAASVVAGVLSARTTSTATVLRTEED